MGDAADDAYARAEQQEADYWLFRGSHSNEELVEETALSRKPIIVGIRRYYKRYKKLSLKQRDVLAHWLYERGYYY